MSAAQIQVILSSPNSFAGLIGNTLSQDNATRRSAEDLYGQLKNQRADACATNLLQLMRSSADAQVRATCSIFLRKFFRPTAKEIGWENLNRSTKAVVKRELLAALAAEIDRSAAKQIAGALVDLGASQLVESNSGKKNSKKGGKKKEAQQDGWPELLASLQAWLDPAASVAPITREAALQIVEGLALPLSHWSGQLAPVVSGCLGTQQSPEVQVAALKAVASFLEVLRKPRELRPFQAALAGGLNALQAVLAAGQLGFAEQLLMELIRTAESEAELWRPHLAIALPGLMALAMAKEMPTGGSTLPDDLRRLAAEFILTLTDIKPQMVQGELGASAVATMLILCIAQFLISGVEDAADWGSDPMAHPDLKEDETLGELHTYGLECADRAASSLDSAAVLGAVVEMTSAWARDSSDWRRRHAVLMCLSQVVGSCKEVVGPAELESLAGLLTEALRDPHPRVRWAGCHCLGVLSDDLGPRLQLQSGGGGAALLRALVVLLGEAEGPACPQRLKAQACRALVGFLEGLDLERNPNAEVGEVAEEPGVEKQQQQPNTVAGRRRGRSETSASAAAVMAATGDLPPTKRLQTEPGVFAGQQSEASAASQLWQAKKAARRATVVRLVGPFLEPLSVSLLANVEKCAAGEGGAAAGGRPVVPTPLQEFSLDAITNLALCLGSDFAPVFPAAMPRVLAVLARAAPFHGPTAVSSGAVTDDEASAITRVQVGSLECAAFMCRAVGAAAALEHVPALSALFGVLARPDIPPTSQLLEPLLGAVEPLATCLGPDMRSLLGPVLPLLSMWVAKDVGLQNFDEEETEEEEEDSEEQSSKDSKTADADTAVVDGSENVEDADSEDRDDSDVAFLSYGGVTYRCNGSLFNAKTAAMSSLDEIVQHMGPALAQHAPVIADALIPRLLDYTLDDVFGMAYRSVPVLLRNYLAALASGSLPPSDPAASPATAQALLQRIWQTLMAIIDPQSAAAAAVASEGSDKRPAPTASVRADAVEILTRLVDCVEGPMLQQTWVADAFAAMQAALAAVQSEAEAAESDSDDDKSMEDDGSEDLDVDESSDEEASEEEEEEDDEAEETDDGAEPLETAKERLRAGVEACVGAFTRKYGDAVATLAQQLLAAQQPEQQRGSVVMVRNGVVV